MRRRVLLGGLAALAAGAAAAHTPYGQWVAYRRKHLLIGCHRESPETYALAQAVAATLADTLPDARARVARAPRPQRLASLLGTGQLELAVLGPRTAEAMTLGAEPFTAYGPLPLTLLAGLRGGFALVAHADFPAGHARQVAHALGDAAVAGPAPDTGLAWHAGAADGPG